MNTQKCSVNVCCVGKENQQDTLYEIKKLQAVTLVITCIFKLVVFLVVSFHLSLVTKEY